MTNAAAASAQPDYSAQVKSLHAYHATLDPQNLGWRKAQLRALSKMLTENKDIFLDALKKDLGTNPTEGALLQLELINSEIEHALKNVDDWAKPQKVPTPLHLKPSSAKIIQEPLGVALIIGAWNYPLLLTLSPLVGCIAAGNAAVIKPSEMSPATSSVIAELLPRYLDPQAFEVIEGAIPETKALLQETFDKIFFTGSAPVGKSVMKAAAEHLTPVTLELGGQCPAIVDKTADIKQTALRIVFAKFSNAGQTCVAPNHVFVHKDVADEFTEAVKETIVEFFGRDPHKSPDYGRIVNQRHHQRLTNLLHGQKIAHGGNADPRDLYISPTVLKDVDLSAPVMQEEIFGPILPLITVGDLSEAFNHISQGEKPLAAYVFTKDKAVMKQAEKIKAGAVCINNAMLHLGVHDLPFGGVGGSGFGQYHGKAGFETFSHAKPVMKSGKLEPGVHYPPHKGRVKNTVLKFFHLI